jgi:glycosyltransferase involved in cell wall biosynthesis
LISLFRKLQEYDVIYARDYHTVIIALLPRLLFQKKLIYEINGLASEEQKLKSRSILNRIIVFFIKRAEKMAVQFSDKIISVTPQIATYINMNINKDFKSPLEKIAVIGNGVDIKRFYPVSDQDLLGKWRDKWGIGKEDLVVAFVGNLARWQGVETFIESGFKLFQKNERLKFLIIGDGPLKENLMKKGSGSQWKQRFIFTGMVNYEEIPFLINIADICVAPFISKRNQKTGVSPIKIFEYMACGKPIVTTRIVGLEFIEKEGIGQLIEPEDKGGLEHVLTDLLRDSNKREVMGQKALILARERFDWEMKVIEIEKVLKELLA